MSTVTAVGLLASLLTAGAWLPQLWRTWQTRSAADLSWAYIGTTAGGMATWLTYGLLAGDVPVIATNLATITLVSGLALLKACSPVAPPAARMPALQGADR